MFEENLNIIIDVIKNDIRNNPNSEYKQFILYVYQGELGNKDYALYLDEAIQFYFSNHTFNDFIEGVFNA